MMQIQSIPTPWIWVGRSRNDPPTDAIATSAVFLGSAWDDLFDDGSAEDGVGTVAGSPVASWASTTTHQSASDGLAVLAGAPGSAWAQLWQFQAASDGLSGLAGAMTTAWGTTYVLAPWQAESVSVQAGAPIASNG
jgi:hypothetical protein